MAESDSTDTVGSPAEAGFVGVTLVCLFFALCRGWYTPEVVVFLSLVVVWNAGIISTAEALSGFSNPGVLAIGALFVVVSSVESSRLADKAAKRAFGLATSFRAGFLRLLLCGVFMSAFCNNTPILTLLIPVTKDWARTRGYDPAVLLMPLAFACAFGGLLTTVGGGTNLVIQGLLYEAGKEDETVGPFRLFQPGYVGLPLALAGVGYLLAAAPRLLAAPVGVGAGGGAGLKDRSEELLTEVEVSEDFELIGQPLALAVATLGLPFDTLVKVRRRHHSPEVDPAGGTLVRPSGTGASNAALGDGDSGGSGGGGGNEACALDSGDEESNRAGWAGRSNGGKVGGSLARLASAGGSGSPFALRRRTYQLLENEDGEERSTRNAGLVKGPCIEMTTRRTAEKAAREGVGGGPPTKVPNGGARYAGVADDARDHDVSPDASRVRAGDVLVLSAARDTMVYAQGSLFSGARRGLKVLGVSTLRPAPAPPSGSLFFELVLSRSSGFLGRNARLDSEFFGAGYDCCVVAFRLKGGTVGGVGVIDGSSSSNGGADDAGTGEWITAGGGLLNTVAARRSPEAAATAAAAGVPGAAIEAAADNLDGGLYFVGEDESLAVNVEESSLDTNTPTPLLSSFVEDGSPATTGPVWPRPAGPGLESTKRQSWQRRRRRRGEAFEAGDVVVVLATERFSERLSSTEFLRMEIVGRLPEATGWFQCVPLAMFVLMLAWVLLGEVEMIRAVFTACAVLIIGGWVDAKHAVGDVNWGLLVLIGCALGFSKAMANSGLAHFAGRAVRESGMSESASLYALFGLTMLCTELISNNAAAALNIPVALSMARELKSDYRPFAMTVLVAASCSFLTPIGTPTNTLVWAPGGYKFQDYAKLGLPLTLLFWGSACAVIPWLFPF
eukprot:g7465.t1